MARKTDTSEQPGVITRYRSWRRRSAEGRRQKQRMSGIVLAVFLVICGVAILLPNTATYIQTSFWTIVAAIAMIIFGGINVFNAFDEFMNPTDFTNPELQPRDSVGPGDGTYSDSFDTEGQASRRSPLDDAPEEDRPDRH